MLLKRGELFPGGLNITRSGSSSEDITFDAYGTGAKLVISGFTILTGWTAADGGV